MSENKELCDVIGESIERNRDSILSNYILQNKLKIRKPEKYIQLRYQYKK